MGYAIPTLLKFPLHFTSKTSTIWTPLHENKILRPQRNSHDNRPEMASDTGISDDYVAELLKNDAKAHALRFSAFGFQNHFPTR